MKIIIHRGTHQIGGCITEILTKDSRIIIDMGEELPNPNIPSHQIDLPGVTSGPSTCDGVFFTHYHGDHIGLISTINPDIPLYLGEAAKDIYLVLQTHLRKKNLTQLNSIKTYKAAEPIIIKDITVTPFVVDHSAYDAYMFLIEADGKRILHTGDFRNHGFKGKGLLKVVDAYLPNIDLLITEGTSLSRTSSQPMTEHELINEAKVLIKEHKYVFVICSSTNIDRISAFYQATPRGKYFICDHYQKDVLKVVENHGKQYSSIYSFEKALYYDKNLDPKLIDRGFCMLIRKSDYFEEILKKFDPEQSLIIYSMWQGYIQDLSTGMEDFLKGHHYVSLHTSGHASRETIKALCDKVNPKIGVLPIHSESPEELAHLGIKSKIISLKDGEMFIV